MQATPEAIIKRREYWRRDVVPALAFYTDNTIIVLLSCLNRRPKQVRGNRFRNGHRHLHHAFVVYSHNDSARYALPFFKTKIPVRFAS